MPESRFLYPPCHSPIIKGRVSTCNNLNKAADEQDVQLHKCHFESYLDTHLECQWWNIEFMPQDTIDREDTQGGQ